MLRSIAYESLVAEAEAWPVASPASFAAGSVRLAEERIGRLDGETQILAAALEAKLGPRAGGLSLEVLAQIRDLAWFDYCPREANEAREVRLERYLVRLAQRYLENHGNRLCLKHQDGIGLAERAGRWRWLSLKLPQDLLVAALAAEERTLPLGEQVSLLTPVLSRILEEQKVAETHLHVGAAVGFPRLWTAIVAGLADAPPQPEEIERAGPPPFGSGEACVGRLFEAAIARLMMARFLRSESCTQTGPGFAASLGAGAAGWNGGHGGAGPESTLAEIWWALSSLDDGTSWPERRAGRGADRGAPCERPACRPEAWRRARLSRLYRRLVLAQGWAPGGRDLARCDPLAQWLLPSASRALPETVFAARALGYLRLRGASDPTFERVFWQYQRVRCLVFGYIVEETGTGGLDWFGRHYQHISALRKSLEPTRYRSALENEAADLNLAALEVRAAPPASWNEVCLEVRRLAVQTLEFHRRRDDRQVPAPGAPPEVALIFHFIKSREQDLSPLPPNPPLGRPRICRYGLWYYGQLQTAHAIAEALRRVPEILLLLRGVDIANAELAVPTWATLPLFRVVRDASAKAAEELARCRPGWSVERVRVTCHLGEEYVRLPQGLRRIHEPIEFGLLETGSRIGHAIALGVDPAAWAREVPTVPQTAQERLEDLLWELDRYGCGDLTADSGRIELVRHEVVRLSRFIFDGSPNLDDLLEARRRLHQHEQLELIGFPFVRRPRAGIPGKDRAFELLWRYLTDDGVFERGQSQVEVSASAGEIAFLVAAQRWLRGVLGRLEITVESNPSSNLLIGSLEALDAHPAFRLLPLPSQRRPDESPVMLSVSTDDPITFASHLADEYAHIYFALMRRKVASEEALAWLDEVRRHGWRSRFSLRASSDPENLRQLCERMQPAHWGTRPRHDRQEPAMRNRSTMSQKGAASW